MSPTKLTRLVGAAVAVLGACAAPTLAAPTGGASAPGTKAKVVVPVLTAVNCLAGGCTRNPHVVQVGGRILLHGHNIKSGMQLMFPARATPVGAVVRLTYKGFVVTVPPAAISGKITLVGQARSKPYGPLRVLPAPAPPKPKVTVAANPAPSGTAFSGQGMWIWYVSKSDGGNLPQLIADAHTAGVTTVYVKSSDGASNYWSQFSPTLVQTLHAGGLHVCAWQYVYGTQPAAEAALGAQAATAGADCLVIDAESEYEGNYSGAQTYIQALRTAVGPNYPVGLASFPHVDYHETLPYSVFLGPGGAQFNLPQMYWYTIGTSVAQVFAHTYEENGIYGRPIMPLGETYGGTPAAQIYNFRQVAAAYGASGISYWDWQETTTAGWAALAQPLTALTGPAPTVTQPTLAKGAKGDQVLWLQEHLAAAEPATPTSGTFDGTTQTQLLAFQAAKGLPQSGVTDAATWTALLQLTPVSVSWTTTATRRG